MVSSGRKRWPVSHPAYMYPAFSHMECEIFARLSFLPNLSVTPLSPGRGGWGGARAGGGGCAGCLWARERYAMSALLCFFKKEKNSAGGGGPENSGLTPHRLTEIFAADTNRTCPASVSSSLSILRATPSTRVAVVMLVLTTLLLSEVHLQGAPSPRSPPPSTPPSTPPSPSPLSGLVSASSDLRFLIDEAQNHGSDVTVVLAPGAHLKLSSQIKCTSNIKVTVASSGERATLDGQGQTGLFRLEGCSLTLRGLILVNGKALSLGGGVVSATGGDVEIIDSTVKDCSAGQVCRAASQPPCSAAWQRNERWRWPRLPHPALSSQPQNGGVISAFRSGAVSLIGSTVTDCSAGIVTDC